MKTFLIVILCVVLGLAVCLALGFLGIEPFTMLSAPVQNWLGGFSMEQVISNPASILTIAGAATTVAVPLIAKASEAKKQYDTIKAEASSKIQSLETSLGDADAKLQTATSNLTDANKTIDSLNTTNATLTAKTETLQAELNKVQGYYTELQKIKAADVIGQLPAATTITQPNGTTLQIVEKKVVV